MELQEHLIMWTGSLLYAVFTIIRRRSSRRTREATTELDYTESKRGIDYLRVLIGYEVLTYALYVVDVNLGPGRMFFQLAFPWWLRWTGVALFAAADVLFFLVHRHLGANFYANLKLRRGHELVTTGPYRLVRHPMYLGLYLNHLGVFLLTANWFIGATWLVGFTLIMIYRLPREEAMMLGRFGRDYGAYRERTGRFLPAGLFRTLLRFARTPDPPRYPLRRIRIFMAAFSGVVLLELTVAAVLIGVYPDDYLAHAAELFFSELGAPVTVFGTPNPVGALVFSANMAGGFIGCAAFIPIIQILFPIASGGFYRRLRCFYLVCLGMISVGCFGVIFPYTTYWALHVISALVCMVGMWMGWSAFVLFNTPWLSFAKRVAVVGVVQAIIWFVIASELAGWRQEFFQKPGQGLVFALVIGWPYLHYARLVKASRKP